MGLTLKMLPSEYNFHPQLAQPKNNEYQLFDGIKSLQREILSNELYKNKGASK